MSDALPERSNSAIMIRLAIIRLLAKHSKDHIGQYHDEDNAGIKYTPQLRYRLNQNSWKRRRGRKFVSLIRLRHMCQTTTHQKVSKGGWETGEEGGGRWSGGFGITTWSLISRAAGRSSLVADSNSMVVVTEENK